MKNWLVTGSSKGLGRAIVEMALARGDRVLATTRNTARLARLSKRFPDTLRLAKLTPADKSEAKAAAHLAVGYFDRLDVLINNAGFGRLAPFETSTASEIREQIEVNLFGVIHLCHAALPIMRRQRDGLIVNVSSLGGRVTIPGFAAYHAAKWGVSGLSEALASEVQEHGIRVVALEPGAMRTGFIAESSDGSTDTSPDHENTVGQTAVLNNQLRGKEPIDPKRVAEIIFDLSRTSRVPAHLVVGRDAFEWLQRVNEQRVEAADTWREISLSADLTSAN